MMIPSPLPQYLVQNGTADVVQRFVRKYAGLFGALALVESLARPLPVQHLAVNILKKSSFPI